MGSFKRRFLLHKLKMAIFTWRRHQDYQTRCYFIFSLRALSSAVKPVLNCPCFFWVGFASIAAAQTDKANLVNEPFVVIKFSWRIYSIKNENLTKMFVNDIPYFWHLKPSKISLIQCIVKTWCHFWMTPKKLKYKTKFPCLQK